MAKVLGVGGVFFKSENPGKLRQWYAKWLGLDKEGPGVSFSPAKMPENGYTVWSAFDSSTSYFSPSSKEFMFNLIVDHLENALQQVKEGGAENVGEIENYDYGRFGWFMDPDGDKVELWQPN
ncbi:VOC family protein [candidate division KSB1 bacterium]|nr:VOC family protein [candidate division KSB1 bacterium]